LDRDNLTTLLRRLELLKLYSFHCYLVQTLARGKRRHSETAAEGFYGVKNTKNESGILPGPVLNEMLARKEFDIELKPAELFACREFPWVN
jgi:hypothetical protein